MPKTAREKYNDLKKWESYISNMEKFQQNPAYTYTKPKNKYYRFMDHVKGWLGEWIGACGQVAQPGDSEEMTEWRRVSSTVIGYGNDWWKAAIKGGATARQSLPTMDNIPEDEIHAELKDIIYDKFMPLYSALKESFEKRSRWEFFTNHRQYTAERDALKAITSVITCFTKDNEQAFQNRYTEYKNEIAAVDPNAPEDAEENQQELTTRNKVEQLDNQKHFFEKTCIKLAHVIQGTAIKFDSLKHLMGNFYAPAFEQAKSFCTEYDNLVSAGPEVATEAAMNKLMEENVMKMFEAAFEITDNKSFKSTHTKQSENDPTKSETIIDHEMSLADRIITAQNVVNVILNEMTPVGFNKDKFADYAKSHAVLKNSDKINEFLKKNLNGKYNETDVNVAIKGAQNQMNDKHFPKQPEMDKDNKVKPQDLSNVLKVGYRTDINNYRAERKALTALQGLMSANKITDPTVKTVINENVRRYKAFSDFRQGKVNEESYNKYLTSLYVRDAALELVHAKDYKPDPDKYMSMVDEYNKEQEKTKLAEKLNQDINKNKNNKKSPPAKEAPDVKKKNPELE